MPAREEHTLNVPLNLAHSGWRKIVDPMVGLRIRELREESGSNIGGIARPLGLRVKTLKAIENGEESADGALLHALGGVFSVPVGFFFEGLPAAVDARANSNQAISRPAGLAGRVPKSRELVKILNTYSRLPDERLRKSLIDLVDALAKASPAS
jgi:transcriptional regulator with XRE-family HTH domain